MTVHRSEFTVSTRGQGLYEITAGIADAVRQSGISDGIVTVFCQHTSCSLVIMENADPTARTDLQDWFNRLVPESQQGFKHTLEGLDDMPSHIKMALTRTSETIPISGGRLLFGTWQGVFLWEHRRASHSRHLAVTVLG